MTTTTKTTTKLKTPVGTNTSAGGSKKTKSRSGQISQRKIILWLFPRVPANPRSHRPALDVHAFHQLDSPVVGELHQGDHVEGQDLYAPLEMWSRSEKNAGRRLSKPATESCKYKSVSVFICIYLWLKSKMSIEPQDVIKKLLLNIDLFTSQGSRIKLRSLPIAGSRSHYRFSHQEQGLYIRCHLPSPIRQERAASPNRILLLVDSATDAEDRQGISNLQTPNPHAMRRLDRTLARNIVTSKMWVKESGYIYRIGQQEIYFLSAAPTSNIVGATPIYC